MKRIRTLLIVMLALVVAGSGWLARYAMHPLDSGAFPKTFSITPGTSLAGLAIQLEKSRVIDSPLAFRLLGRLLGKATRLKAGVYELDQPLTPLALYGKIERGEVVQAAVRFIEGWTLRDARAALKRQDQLTHDSDTLSEAELLVAMGASESHLEGLLFPDTYFFAPLSSDLEILRRAYRLQRSKLDAAWEQRAPGLPYRNAYDALIMASIIEKETGSAIERPMIAAVFLNRLKRGMRLQTDPTVIYGLGEMFDGNLRRVDLERDTPYNTYTRAGLPPTPIALPSLASIHAALHPAQTDVLYFVSRGDGSHIFSATLDAHNRAVNRYQRGI